MQQKGRVLWIVECFGQDEHEGSQIQRSMYKVYEIGEVTYSNQTTSEKIYSTIYREMYISKWHSTIPQWQRLLFYNSRRFRNMRVSAIFQMRHLNQYIGYLVFGSCVVRYWQLCVHAKSLKSNQL